MSVKSCRHCCRKPTVLVPLCLITALGVLFNSKMISLVTTPSFHDYRSDSSVPTCKERTNVVFIKTHKCASSTIQNIFMRYGDIHNLTFVLPAISNYLGHPTPFKRTMVPDPARYHVTYNILTHHSRFNYKEMKFLMPNDTVFVTIVRDPVDLYESLYSYYSLQNVYKKNLVQALDQLKLKFFDKRIFGRVGTNQMLYDLGYSFRKSENDTYVIKYVKKLDTLFDLVMVAERMEESLILLRHLMCWKLDDVVAFKVNARNKKFRSNLTEEAREKVRKLNSKDQLLYDYFTKRFEDRVREFGKSAMEEEVSLLRNKTLMWYDYCVNPVPSAKLSKVIVYEQKHSDNASCQALTRQELSYTDRLRRKQRYMFPTSKQSVNKKTKPRYKTRRRISSGVKSQRRGK